jgi:hypothetical protein
VLYNPPGFRSADQHFAIYSPREPTSGSNIPSPARTDSGLMIRGNNIANGPSDLPLGIEGSEVCLDSNPSCSETQLRDDNSINQGIPLLRDPSRGDFRPDPSGDILTGTAILIPDFTDIGRPQSPAVPTGILTNMFPEDRGGTPRHSSSPPGAYSTSTSPLERPMEDSSIPETPGDDSLRTPPDIRISRLRIRRVTDRRVRLSVTALCLSDTESITRVRGSFAARGSKLKTYAMRAIGNSSYRGVLTTRTNASRAVVSIRATTSSGASRIKRRNLRLPRF